jgi:alkylhydroperoxidase family enzyme
MSRIGPFADDDAAAWVVKSPDIGVAMAGFTNAVYTKNRLPMRVRELARMVIALDNECVVCQNTRDSEGIAAGVDEDLYDHAAEWRTWPGYSAAERVAAEFAERFAKDHTALRDDEDFWARCNEQFDDELLTDLALSCAMWLGMGRMLRTLDIGQTCDVTGSQTPRRGGDRPARGRRGRHVDRHCRQPGRPHARQDSSAAPDGSIR